MRDNHITEILDSKPFATLSETELATIRSHIVSCASCNGAYDAAQISALLIKERADEAAQSVLNANPFFQTRVMAAWRERADNVSALRRLWNATSALVTTMAATTAALAVLTFVAPSSETTNQPTAALVPYSAEAVVLDQSDNDQVTDDQVLSAIYADEDEGR